MRQLRHSYHVISIKRVAFDVADSAFYNVHMIVNCRTLVGPPLLHRFAQLIAFHGENSLKGMTSDTQSLNT